MTYFSSLSASCYPFVTSFSIPLYKTLKDSTRNWPIMMIDWDITETKCVPSWPTEEIMDCYLVSKTPLHAPGCRLQGVVKVQKNCIGGGWTSQKGKIVSSLLHALMLSKLSFIMRHTELSVPAVDGVIVFKHGCHTVHTIASCCISTCKLKLSRQLNSIISHIADSEQFL